jgi:hypothetical protein
MPQDDPVQAVGEVLELEVSSATTGSGSRSGSSARRASSSAVRAASRPGRVVEYVFESMGANLSIPPPDARTKRQSGDNFLRNFGGHTNRNLQQQSGLPTGP